MESLLTDLQNSTYFIVGFIIGGGLIFLLSVLCFSGPLWNQQKDINRLEEDKKAANKKIDTMEEQMKSAELQKERAENLYYSENKRASLLEAANGELQGEINDLTERYNKLYVELDALKARTFQEPQTNEC